MWNRSTECSECETLTPIAHGAKTCSDECARVRKTRLQRERREASRLERERAE